MRRIRLNIILCMAMVIWLITGCSYLEEKAEHETLKIEEEQEDLITVGFAQVGAESDWRITNTASMKSTFVTANGYELIFADAKQKQANQITAVREFIQQEVDYILLAAVTETGWDTVLQEAKDAKIPVILVDRKVDVADDSLWTAWIGGNFKLEGQKACAWLKAYADAKGIEELNIAHIQGTIGASAQIGRTEALEEAAGMYGWTIVAQESGDFTKAKGQEVMEMMLAQHEDINVVYCENDNEAFGVIDAIRAAGKTVGPDGDILVLSFDANKAAMEMVMNGEIICNTECNPLQGPVVDELIQKLEAGETVEREAYLEEGIFAYGGDVPTVTVDGVVYAVTEVTQEVLDGRAY